MLMGSATLTLLAGFGMNLGLPLERSGGVFSMMAGLSGSRETSLPPAAPDIAVLSPGLAADPLALDTLRRLDEALDPDAPPMFPDFEPVDQRVPSLGGPQIPARAWYVVDSITGEVLLANRADRPYPIASISKLMGALIYADTESDPNEPLTIQDEDRNFLQVTRSRLRPGYRCLAGDLLFHSLLPSDNRATTALMRQTGLPLEQFRQAMNRRAAALGLTRSHFEEPTGLDSGNIASARDITVLLEAALANPRLSPVIVQKEHWYYRDDAPVMLGARSSNRLSHNETWEVIASKTGFTYAAGSCLVMKSRLRDGRLITMGVLGAPGEKGRYPAAEAIRAYLEDR